MAHAGMVEVYVEQLLAERFGEALRVGTEGGRSVFVVPLPAAPLVRVVGTTGNGLRVLVTAAVAFEVTVSPALLEALNDVNERLPYGRVFVVGDEVMVEDTVLGRCVDPASLHNAIDVVCWVVEAHGAALAQVGGGRAALSDDVEEEDPRADARGGAHPPSAEATPEAVAAHGPAGQATVTGGVPAGTPGAVNAAGYL